VGNVYTNGKFNLGSILTGITCMSRLN